MEAVVEIIDIRFVIYNSGIIYEYISKRLSDKTFDLKVNYFHKISKKNYE